jgi:hypothetical protein
LSSKYDAQLSDEGMMRWRGAGGPAFYLQGSQPSRVVAILYWTDSDPEEEGTRPEISPPGWRLVFTHNGDVWTLSLPAFDDSGDQAAADRQVDAAIEAATRLIEVEL